MELPSAEQYHYLRLGINLLLLWQRRYNVKKRIAVFLSPAGMSLTKLSLAGNNLRIPGQGEFGK
jgi:hypothetical protein